MEKIEELKISSKNAVFILNLHNLFYLCIDFVNSIEIYHFVHPQIWRITDNLHHLRPIYYYVYEFGQNVRSYFLTFFVQFWQWTEKNVVIILLWNRWREYFHLEMLTWIQWRRSGFTMIFAWIYKCLLRVILINNGANTVFPGQRRKLIRQRNNFRHYLLVIYSLIHIEIILYAIEYIDLPNLLKMITLPPQKPTRNLILLNFHDIPNILHFHLN